MKIVAVKFIEVLLATASFTKVLKISTVKTLSHFENFVIQMRGAFRLVDF